MARQAGIKRRGHGSGLAAYGLIIRGIVLRTYLPTDPRHPALTPVLARTGAVSGGRIGEQRLVRYLPTDLHDVLCDVLPFGSRSVRSTVMHLVPVAQEWSMGDVWSAWTPRACSRALDGSQPQPTAPQVRGAPATITDPNLLDGDRVLVAFCENDLNQPIILRGLKHPHAATGQPAYHPVTGVLGPASVQVFRHRGTIYRVDSDGNVLIDATAASSGALGPTGTELPGTGGTVTIKAKTTARLQGGTAVELAQGGAAATRPVARANDSTLAQLVPVVGPNKELAAFVVQVCAAFQVLLTNVGFPPAPGGYATWADFATATLLAGISGTITSGNTNVRTD